MAICSRIRMHIQSPGKKILEEKEPVFRNSKEAVVTRPECLGHRYEDHKIRMTAVQWNYLVAFIYDLFGDVLKWAEGCDADMEGAGIEEHFFASLRRLFQTHAAGLASEMLSCMDTGNVGRRLGCSKCGGTMTYRGNREITILTCLGNVTLHRAYYTCDTSGCSETVFPLDVKLGIDEHRALPGMGDLIARLCAEMSYETAMEVLGDVIGKDNAPCVRMAEEVCWDIAKDIKEEETGEVYEAFQNPLGSRLPAVEEHSDMLALTVDGTCVPTGAKEEFHEAKLGVISQIGEIHEDRDGALVSDLVNHRYTVHVGNADDFFERYLMECARCGAFEAKRLVLMGDGAPWIWNRFREHFGDAGMETVEILDFWHCMEHVADAGELVYGTKSAKWNEKRKKELLEGRLRSFFAALSWGVAYVKSRNDGESLAKLLQEIEYFKNHRGRMEYSRYRREGLPIGSGVVEGGCKHVIKDRTCRSGMRWSVNGCEAILKIRAKLKSKRWGRFRDSQWKQCRDNFRRLQNSALSRKAA